MNDEHEGTPMPNEEASANEPSEGPLPSLPSRLVAVFVSPGKLMRQLAVEPKWGAALLVTMSVVALSVTLIPVEIYVEMNRQFALERGAEFPEMSEGALNAMRIGIPVGGVLTMLVFTFLFSGIYTVIFAFVLGDEGRYTQYLAVVTHAWFIAGLFGLLVTPLRISTGDPQFTVNLASFFFFLPDGYFLNVLRAMDFSQIWSTLVIAQGVHSIDRRRSFGSAAMILMVLLLGVAMIAARFM